MRGYICFAAICVVIAGFFFGLSQNRMDSGRDRNRSRIIGRSNQFIHRIIGRFSLTRITNEIIKKTKDLAAGAVLIMAIAAAIVGSIIFFP